MGDGSPLRKTVKPSLTTKKFRASLAERSTATKSCPAPSTCKEVKKDTYSFAVLSSRRQPSSAYPRGTIETMTHFLRDILRQPKELQRTIEFLLRSGAGALEAAKKAIVSARHAYLTGIGS